MMLRRVWSKRSSVLPPDERRDDLATWICRRLFNQFRRSVLK